MEDEKCYVFKPGDERPSKCRRVESSVDASWPARERLYQISWLAQQRRLQNVIDDASRATFDEILAFLDKGDDGGRMARRDTIKAGYVLAGPDTTSHAALFATLKQRIRDEQETRAMIAVRASDAPNLKSLLKVIIRKVLDISHTLEVESNKLLDYDLQAVHSWLQDKDISSLVVGIIDSEAFQASVLADLIDLLRSWKDRIPVTILFGIATSIEIFQDRLPRVTSLTIEATQFDVVQSDELLERLFEAVVTTDEDNATLCFGPQLLSTILQRQKQNIKSSSDFMNAVQYAHMCHFYANRFSILLPRDFDNEAVTPEICKAIRALKSFQSLVDDMIDEGDLQTAEALMQSDNVLLRFVTQKLGASLTALHRMTNAVRLVRAAQAVFTNGNIAASFSTTYLDALRGDFRGSAALREFLLSVKKSPSDVLTRILSAITPFIADEHQKSLDPMRLSLKRLLQDIQKDKEVLKSRFDARNETMRTTVIAHKVELSRHKASISEEDAAYSKIVEAVHDWLANYLDHSLVAAHELLFHEILVYDSKGPDRAIFMPRHRYVVERALSSPHDYLNCDCCKDTAADHANEAALAKTQPYTALLYQLYTESGALINAADLWTAFNGILSDDGDEDEPRNMYLFQRALAELKFLGFVRSTKRKTDHLVKVSWKGL